MVVALLEGADLVFPVLGIGPAAFNALVVASLLGFPVAIALAWTFDVSGGGIRRTGPAEGEMAAGTPDRWARLKASLVGAGFVLAVWLGVSLWQPTSPRGGDDVPTEGPVLAVLTFEDFSPEGDQAYFADGLHEEILHQLDKLRGIRLISRTSVAHFRGSPATVPVIADSLGARYVLEGSVRQSQDSVRLTVQLIDGLSDEHLWSESYGRRRTLEGLFDLQRTLAMRVAGSVVGTLGDQAGQDLGAPPTTSLEAYNAFLRGLHQWSQFDIEHWWNAVDDFERAVTLDPEFARAHARLAMAYGALNNYGGRVQGELFPRIREHAEAAIRLAPDHPESHMARMTVEWPIEWDWEAARTSAEQALALDPDLITARWVLAEWHGVIAGDTDRGLEIVQDALRLDPFSAQLRMVRAWILLNGRRFEEAAEEHERILALEPRNMSAQLSLVTALALAGRQAEARSHLEGILAALPTPWSVTMATHLARVGDPEAARDVLAQAVALKESGGSVPASGIAGAYAALGEIDEALTWLERCFAEEGGIYYLRSPDWYPLLGHSRFQALWDRVGLPGEGPTGPD